MKCLLLVQDATELYLKSEMISTVLSGFYLYWATPSLTWHIWEKDVGTQDYVCASQHTFSYPCATTKMFYVKWLSIWKSAIYKLNLLLLLLMFCYTWSIDDWLSIGVTVCRSGERHSTAGPGGRVPLHTSHYDLQGTLYADPHSRA